jgi:hypothetical protein
MARLPLALVTLALVAAPALAAPKVAVVTLSREGLTEEQADAIASDVAVAVSTQIEGDAIAGSSVRDRLEPGTPADGCEEQPSCARDLANHLKVDEVLLLAMHVAGKTTIVASYRVPHDPSKPTKDRTMRLAAGKAKRTEAIAELATALYPAGSVTESKKAVVEKAPADDEKPPEKNLVVAPVEKKPEKEGEKRPIWFWPVIGGGAAVVVIIAIVLGVALGTTASPTGAAVNLP